MSRNNVRTVQEMQAEMEAFAQYVISNLLHDTADNHVYMSCVLRIH